MWIQLWKCGDSFALYSRRRTFSFPLPELHQFTPRDAMVWIDFLTHTQMWRMLQKRSEPHWSQFTSKRGITSVARPFRHPQQNYHLYQTSIRTSLVGFLDAHTPGGAAHEEIPTTYKSGRGTFRNSNVKCKVTACWKFTKFKMYKSYFPSSFSKWYETNALSFLNMCIAGIQTSSRIFWLRNGLTA